MSSTWIVGFSRVFSPSSLLRQTCCWIALLVLISRNGSIITAFSSFGIRKVMHIHPGVTVLLRNTRTTHESGRSTTRLLQSSASSSSSSSSTAIPSNHRGGPSTQRQTARESAVLVEWERRSEFQRRIEDGVDYEHYHELNWYQQNGNGGCWSRQSRSESTEDADSVDIRSVPGVFCGYRTTVEEYCRLRSANLPPKT